MDIREIADGVWNGSLDSSGVGSPRADALGRGEAWEVADGVFYYRGFASVAAVDTGESLVMLDSGGRNEREAVYSAIRAWRPDRRLAAAVFSHHHVDHIFGVAKFDEEAAEKRQPRPLVYGHEAVPYHFDRYKKTPGWNAAINLRQFIPRSATIDPTRAVWSTDYRYPDVTYRDRVTFTAGDLSFELNHDRGETEDNTWTWIPEKKLLAPGDLFIWCSPNAGNPQKVQRYVGDWAAGLRKMAALDAELLIPGHGWPIFGAERVRTALADTAQFLESIEEQTLALMNRGASLDTVLHSVAISKEALEKPYLRPVYDHPEFLIRNIWRLYGGWYDGQPDQLLPSPRARQAAEWVALAGGLDNVLDRARALMKEDTQLACHVIEFAVLAEPTSEQAHALRSEIYEARAAEQSSLMARGIFSFAAASSRGGKRDAFDRDA